MRKRSSFFWYILAALLLTGGIAGITAHWTPGDFSISFRAAAVITLPFVILSLYAYQRGGKGFALAIMMFLTFALRLGFGLATVNLLPE